MSIIDNSNLLLEDISKLYNNPNNCDVKIIVGEGDNIKTFKAHSIILRARSNYFNIKLSNKWTKNVIIPNINPRVFKTILKYFYTGNYSLYEDCIIELLITADELRITELVEHIQENIIYNKTSWIRENFTRVYNVAFKYEEFKFIREYCNELINKNAELIFESRNFNLMDESLLTSIIKRDELALEEIEIWNYVVEWGMKQKPLINSELSNLSQEDYNKLKNRLHGIFQHIRFFTISSNDFWKKIWPLMNLFSENLLNKLVNYHLPSRVPPPIGSLSKRIPKKLYDSDIINYRQANIIANWIDKIDEKFEHKLGVSYNYELLLRGSRDGMNMSYFESLCSEHIHTLILIKIKGSEKIVGGFNPKSWTWDDDDDYYDYYDDYPDYDDFVDDDDDDDDDDDEDDDNDDDENDDENDDEDDDEEGDENGDDEDDGDNDSDDNDDDDGNDFGNYYDDDDDYYDIWFEWLNTSESFIFSFDNTKIDSYILSRVKKPNNAIVFGDKIGFGDLQFFPYGYYNHRYYKKKIIDKNSFIIEDYEVFAVF